MSSSKSSKEKTIQIRRQFEQLPKNFQTILHHVNIDGTKLLDKCEEGPEAKEKLKSILMEIDFIHLHFKKDEDKLLKIARDFFGALAIFKPNEEVMAGTKRKRTIKDNGNKRAKC
ncbi:984_t:CDS:2 [Diversispora eburnea]|uniref:984_t:CDS:1 n=1 Tax=Diversispora eburnea TaxID=1213867 RepID=A0A9N8ZBJ8_9GLOM|nr:984_t:CDS:2 [Diversispora eburnea]